MLNPLLEQLVVSAGTAGFCGTGIFHSSPAEPLGIRPCAGSAVRGWPSHLEIFCGFWLQDKEFVPLLESWDQLFVANCAEWSLQQVLGHEWTLAGQGINAFNLEYGHKSCWSSSTAIKADYKLHFCLCNYCLGSSKGVIWAMGAEESLCHGCLMSQQPLRRAQRGPVPLWFQTHPVLACA